MSIIFLVDFLEASFCFLGGTHMKLDITSITKNTGATINIEMEEALEDLITGIGTVSFIGPVHFSGSITNLNGLFLLSGIANISYKTICDRCAIDIKRDFQININEKIIYNKGSEDLNDKDENFIDDRYNLSGNYLDLDRIIVDGFLTSIPTTHLCSEECQGLCDICGCAISEKSCSCYDTDKIDSRFEILKGYFD